MKGKDLFVYLSTTKTPEIRLSQDINDDSLYILSIKGRSIPENPLEFFTPIIDKLLSRIPDDSGVNKIIIDLKLDYINSISIKFFIKILKRISEHFKAENIVINWYYEDEDIYDLGKDLEFMTGLNFNFVEVD